MLIIFWCGGEQDGQHDGGKTVTYSAVAESCVAQAGDLPRDTQLKRN